MKKNLTLFGILIALLGVTYLVQEKKTEKNFEESLVKDRLFTGEINELTISGQKIERKDGRWWHGEELYSQNLFRMIEEKLRQLKMVKAVEGKSEDFFSNPVNFTVNGEELVLGDLSLDRQGFYLSRAGKIMLAVLEGSGQEIVTNEKDLQTSKLSELKALLSKPPAELREAQLFRFYPELPFERATVRVPDFLPFELDIKNNTTTPPPFPGISPFEKLGEKFMSLLSQVTLKSELPYGKFGPKLGEITFQGGGKAVMWELFARSEKSADAVLVDPVRRKAWLMIGGTLRIFFVQIQDYWDKKNIPPEKFRPFEKEPMVFTQGNRRAVVTLVNREPLEYETKDFRVDREKMTELVSYALNLGPLDQASRVSLLSNTERKQVLSEEHLRLEIFGEELLFWKKAEELIIVNLTQGFKAHYPRANVSEGFHFGDVLK